MSWHFLERWVEKANQHSTLIGKFWITFLIVCRMVIVATVGDRVYNDEQSEFKCNTLQPGCTNVCFNDFSPISHLRFWSFQILFVATPSVMFVIYSAHKSKVKKATSGRKSYDEDDRRGSKRLSQSKLPGSGKGCNEKKERRRRRLVAKQSDDINQRPSKTSLCSIEKFQQWRRHNAPWVEGTSPFPKSTLIRLRESCDHDNQLDGDYSMKNHDVTNRTKLPYRESVTSYLMNPNQMKNPYYVTDNVNNNNSGRDQFFVWKKPGHNAAEGGVENEEMDANLANGVAWVPQGEAETQGLISNGGYDDASPNRGRRELRNNLKGEDLPEIPSSPLGPIPSAPPGYPGLDDPPVTKPNAESWIAMPKEFEASHCFKEKKSKQREKASKEQSELKQPAILFAEHFRWYVANVFVRLCLEAGFAVLQLKLFGLHVPELFKCKRWPCPNMVDCFISRPTEKTIFLWFMFIYSCICVVLNVVEIIYLFYAYVAMKLAERKRRLNRKRLKKERETLKEKLNSKNLDEKTSGANGLLGKDKIRQMVLVDDSSSSWSSKHLHPGLRLWQNGHREYSAYGHDGRKDRASQDFIAIMLDSDNDDDNVEIDIARAEEDDINEMEEQNLANYDHDLNMGLDNDDGDQAGSM